MPVMKEFKWNSLTVNVPRVAPHDEEADIKLQFPLGIL
jgi:hypothetical protein